MRSIIASLVLVIGCGDVEPAEPDGGGAADAGMVDATAVANVAGKHVHTMTVEGQPREVIVYVPELAVGTTSAPVVFMFHGTSGDGEKFYNISRWKEKADAEGLIAVFPSALTYCLKEDENRDGDFEDPGELAVTTKWAAGSLGTEVQPLCTTDEVTALSATQQALVDHPLLDDVAFVDAMLDLLASSYVVDADRVYASGFSNGGGMTSRLALERADRFAAIAAAAGSLKLTPAPAARPLSLVFSLGTLDDGFVERAGVGELPITATMFEDVPVMAEIAGEYLATLQLEDIHTFEEQSVGGKRIGRYTFATSSVGAANTFTFVLVEDLEHQYPNGTNHPLEIVDPLWTFFATQAL